MNAFIRLLYSLLIAVSVVTFLGVAIFSFYQPPKGPTFPSTYSATDDSQFKAYDKASKAFKPKEQAYQRKVAVIALVAAAAVLVTGLYVFKNSGVIGEGLSLGGVATSIYAIITASIGDGRLLRLLAVSLFLVSTVLVAQRRFVVESAKK